MSLSTKTIFWCSLKWIPFLLLLPFLFLLLSFLYIYKLFVITLSKILRHRRRDLISPVSGLDIMFTTDDFYNQPLGSLAFIWYVNGELSPELITSRLEEALTASATTTSKNYGIGIGNGVSGYEKLTSVYPTFWLGIPFWKRCEKEFNLTHHVKLIKGCQKNFEAGVELKEHFTLHLDLDSSSSSSNTTPNINHLISCWMSKPFLQGQPLWEILFLLPATATATPPPQITLPSREERKTIAFFLSEDLSHEKFNSIDPFTRSPPEFPPSPPFLVEEKKLEREQEQEKNKKKKEPFHKKINGCKSILILRTHHVLGDGISMLQLLQKIVDSPLTSPPVQQSTATAASPSSFYPYNNKVKVDNQRSMRRRRPSSLNREKSRLEEIRENSFTTTTTTSAVIKLAKTREMARVTKQEEIRARPPLGNKSFQFTTTYALQSDNFVVDGASSSNPNVFSSSLPVLKTKTKEKKKVIKLCNEKKKMEKKQKEEGKEDVERIRWRWWWCRCHWRLWFVCGFSKIVGNLWRKLSNTIYFGFFIPSAFFSFINDFVFHSDLWFTQRKESNKGNFVTMSLPVTKLSEVRRKLWQKTRFNYNNENGDDDAAAAAKQKEVAAENAPLPLVVIAVSALSSALRRVLLSSLPVSLEEKKMKGNDDDGDADGKEQRKRKISLKEEEDGISRVSSGTSVSTHSTSTTSPFFTKLFSFRSLQSSIVKFVVAVPLEEQHPGESHFCNFWTHGILKVDLREEDPLRRALQLNHSYKAMRSLECPHIYHKFVKLYSVFPKFILSLLSGYNMGAAIGVTNMADSSNSDFLGGNEVTSKYAYFGLQWRHASLTLALLSYNGAMHVSVLVNESIIKEEKKVEQLLQQYFMEELSILEESGENRSRGSGKESGEPSSVQEQ